MAALEINRAEVSEGGVDAAEVVKCPDVLEDGAPGRGSGVPGQARGPRLSVQVDYLKGVTPATAGSSLTNGLRAAAGEWAAWHHRRLRRSSSGV